jgi:exopolysaccharide biosynthesis polyprenyl glycosylphosphotransferase
MGTGVSTRSELPEPGTGKPGSYKPGAAAGAGAGAPGEEMLPGSSPRLLTAFRLGSDLIALGLSIGGAFLLRFRLEVLQVRQAQFNSSAHAAVSLLWVVGVIASMASLRLYDEDTLVTGGREMLRLRRALIEGVALVATAVFLLQLFAVSRGWFVLVALFSWGALSLERLLTRRFVEGARKKGRLRRTAVFVTSGEAQLPDLDEFRFVVSIEADDLTDWLETTRSVQGGRFRPPVILIDETVGSDDFWRLAVQAGEAGCAVFSRSPIRAVSPDRLAMRELDGHTIVKIAPPALTGFRAFEKRTLDLFVSIFLLPLAAIPMALIAVAVLLGSGRPVLYAQQRVGRNGKLFRMWKFRTMRPDAEDDSGPIWANTETGDPRATRVGRVLRRFSLDELPQIWNVIRGDMSLVGPRPERPLFVTKFSDGIPWYRNRHRMRPGITGLAQVEGSRGDTPLGPRIEFDNRYIEQWSLILDLRIVFRTVAEVIRGRGAG